MQDVPLGTVKYRMHEAAADEKGNDRYGGRCPEGNGNLVIV